MRVTKLRIGKKNITQWTIGRPSRIGINLPRGLASCEIDNHARGDEHTTQSTQPNKGRNNTLGATIALDSATAIRHTATLIPDRSVDVGEHSLLRGTEVQKEAHLSGNKNRRAFLESAGASLVVLCVAGLAGLWGWQIVQFVLVLADYFNQTWSGVFASSFALR